jgi:hypothetical protein
MKQVIEEKLYVENFPNFSGKKPWKFSEIFRKNMKFSRQFFCLTSLARISKKFGSALAEAELRLFSAPLF